MSCHKAHLLWCFHFALILILPGSAQAFKLRIGYVGLNVPQSILFVTKEAGLLDKNGIEPELIFFSGGSAGVAAMLAGDVPIAQSVGPEIVHAALSGADIVAVAVAVPRVTMAVVTGKEITKPEQLKGKRIAVSRFGSLSDGALRLALEKAGLKQGEVTILQLGSTPSRVAALQSGQIGATIVTMDFAIQAKKLGFNVLLDLAKLGIVLPQTGISTTRAYIRQQPEVVRRVVRAYVEGIHYFVTHEKESINTITRHLRLSDLPLANEMYRYVRNSIARKPYVPVEGMQNAISVAALQSPEAKNLNAEQLTDNRFIKELDDKGFIDQLYK